MYSNNYSNSFLRYAWLLVLGCLCLFSLLLTGCSPKQYGDGIQVDPTLHTVSQSDLLASDTIELPMNYNEENYRKLVMAVSFQGVGDKPGEISQEIVQTLSSRLQTEMKKLNRFTIYSLHNRGGVRLLENLSKVGEARIEVPVGQELPSIDLVLTGAILATKEKHDRFDHKEIVYEVDCDFSCEEVASHSLAWAEKAKGRVIRTQTFAEGMQIGGFNDRNSENQKQAIYAAGMKSLIVLANKLGNIYPVGGQVTGLLGDDMTLNRGFEHGIGKDTQMVVYTNVSGVDLPIALAVAYPSVAHSTLSVYKWNTKHKYAKKVIKNMQDDMSWIDNHTLYAVSAGASVPPEWENEYGDN